MILPDNKWVGFIFIIAAIAVLFFDVRITGWHLQAVSPSEGIRKTALAGLIICVIGTIGFGTVYLWPHAKKEVAASGHAKPWKHEMEDLFKTGFNRLLSTEQTVTFTAQNKANGLDTTIPVRFRMYQDFDSHTDFVSLYIPTFHDSRLIDMMPSLLISLRDQIPKLREQMRSSVEVGSSAPGTNLVWAKDLAFSGRVFIWTLNSLTAIQIGEISKAYRDKNMFLEIRGSDYWTFHQND